MFTTLKQRILLGLYLFLILSIPMGAYLASQIVKVQSSADQTEEKKSFPVLTPKPTLSPSKELLGTSELLASKSSSPKPDSTPEATPTTATSFGPTLALKITLDGRPASDQSTRLFVGIVEGDININPKFLLSFTVNVAKNGQYSDLSLAGLTPGNKYSALLKSSAQIATSSAFYMSPSQTNLNDSKAINLVTGDLNDDNQITPADYSIILKALGTTSVSSNWNENADFNKDGVVNTLDLSIINKNIGKTGDSGIWSSPVPVATPSAQIKDNPAIGGPLQDSLPDGSQGHWIWVTNISNP